jgi:hypothetical protein
MALRLFGARDACRARAASPFSIRPAIAVLMIWGLPVSSYVSRITHQAKSFVGRITITFYI